MGIEEDITFMETVPQLRLLGRAALRIIAIGAETRYVHGGEVLFRKGEKVDSGYLVQEGTIKLTEDGDERNGRDAAAGTLIGEAALIAETVSPVTAIAAEPSTVMRITRPLFIKMLEGYPDAARRLRDQMAARAEQSLKDIQRVRGLLDGRRTTQK